MKIDLCELFGVEEGEEFKFKLGEAYYKYSISGNKLVYYDEDDKKWRESSRCWRINKIYDLNTKVTKLPKKKFTDDELCILKNIDKKYKYIIRDDDGDLTVYIFEPYRDGFMWRPLDGGYEDIVVFNHLFQNIQWEDEPVFIDDYVERS